MDMKRTFLAALAAALSVAALAQGLPYQDPGLSPGERARDLCPRLTLEEKARLMVDISEPVERLGIPGFIWWSEALHGVGRNGKCTVFPSCIGMAASFDDALLERIFTAVSDEARAKNTAQRRKGGVFRYQGLSFWTPNINIFRDPRWGRGQETYGEDPYMNSRMGLAVVRGLQGPAGSKYRKLLACAKHYAVHSGPEGIRHTFDVEDLTSRDLWETYLPAFRELVVTGGVREVMCAYQRFEGDPCCGSRKLLQRILREEWGFRGLVVSDCGAIGDFWREGRHGVSPDAEAASARAVASGTDLECGTDYGSLPDAVRSGKLSEADVDRSLVRLLEARIELGDLDPDSLVEWTSIPESVVACGDHVALALEMAREQMVLLKNDGILPLGRDAGNIVVMGPNAADSIMLWGIYYGQPTHSVTVLEGIEGKLGAKVRHVRGCGITDMTQGESLFGRLVGPDGNPGMRGRFWNGDCMDGDPVHEGTYASPLRFDNGGNTSFAPGVGLERFVARFEGSFTAGEDGDVFLAFRNDDGVRLIVDGDTVVDRWREQELKYDSYTLVAKAGERHDICLEYMQVADGATLDFDVTMNRERTVDEVLAQVGDAGTVVFVGGITPELEREEASVSVPGFDRGDRTTIELPQVQRDLLRALREAGKKVVLVNCSGGAVALAPEAGTCNAILQAWYPGEQGGNAVADVLFGDCNPSGKLPVTFYADDGQLPPFEDYSMRGRTYRYFDGEPLYPFGYGLSYTTFSVGEPSYDAGEGRVTVEVTNTGNVRGTEVVQAYVRYPGDADGPAKALRGFARVDLFPGETGTVAMDMPRTAFEWWDVTTNTMRTLDGDYELMVGTSSRDADLRKITVRP